MKYKRIYTTDRKNFLDVDLKKIILVAEKNSVKIYRTNKCNYIMKKDNKYFLLIDELQQVAIKYNFKIEQYQKNSKIIHAGITDLEYKKLEKYKIEHNINTNQAIKKLIATI